MAVRRFVVLTGAIVLAGWQAQAQTPTVAEASPQQAVAAAVTAPAEKISAANSAVATMAAQPATAAPADVPPLKPRPKDEEKKGKKGKEVYTGPTTIIELPPTPMLDEQGQQRLDPDAKPMWNPSVKQQRDKKGHPLFDENGKPVFQTATELGFDEHGKKIKVKKEKEPKKIPVSIARGTMTVDGMTGKAALNYDIADLKYMYLYAPGIGVVVVSSEPFPGATEEKKAFNLNTLTVTVGEHTLQVASEKNILGMKPESAFVLIDRSFTLPSRFPVMGYGTLRKPPYQWPGSKQNGKEADVADFAPPPPTDLLPTQLLAPCPTGQIRKPAPQALPGQTAAIQPCVPIKAAQVPPAKTTASVESPAK